MAIVRLTLNHKYVPTVETTPINPVYEDRMYVTGWLFSIETVYKKEMISCDGFKEVWKCSICGGDINDELHKEQIMRVDRIN